MKRLIIAIAAGWFAYGLPPMHTQRTSTETPTVLGALSTTEAQANTNRRVARRVARRTTRRVNRRHDYYRALPRGCVRVGLYWRCGGVYYNEIIQDGATVYIIVTP